MAEEFQGGVCGGNWWNPPRNLFGSSPCSSSINDIGSFMGWPPSHELIMDMKTQPSHLQSSDDSAGSASDGSSSHVDLQKPHHAQINGNMAPSIDSTLQMMGISLSSSTTTDDWNQDLLHDSARSEGNYSHILQESAPSMNYRQETGCPQNFQQQQPFNSMTTTTTSSNPTESFPLNYNYMTSSLLQTLFDTDSVVENNLQAVSYNNNSNDFLPKGSANNNSLMMKPSFVKQPMHFSNSNSTPFWNATAASLTDVRASFLPSTLQSQFINPSSINHPKPNHPSFTAKHQNEKGGVEKKGSSEPAFKRPRIETPSPLPTFKVRKEKLGDRITALQQLVSPFGKTDTASVLHEAIEYIKFLHDQVSVLSTPYLKNGSPPQHRQHAADQKIKDIQEGLKQDLKSRGLCLVPISSTFPVAAETPTDFWTPTFGGSFR